MDEVNNQLWESNKNKVEKSTHQEIILLKNLFTWIVNSVGLKCSAINLVWSTQKLSIKQKSLIQKINPSPWKNCQGNNLKISLKNITYENSFNSFNVNTNRNI